MSNATFPTHSTAARRGLVNAGIIWLMLCTVIGGWLLYRGAKTNDASATSGQLTTTTTAQENSAARRTTNIENIRVGQRVATDGGLSNNGAVASDTAHTLVDRATWRWVTIRAEQRWPDRTLDTWDIQTLQPPAWLEKHRAEPRGVIELNDVVELAEMGVPRDVRGEIVSVSPVPTIASGPGRVVLATVNHLNNFIFDLTLKDASGVVDTLGVTGWHKMFSESRGWVSASELKAGETLRSFDGPLVVASLVRRSGADRVYNMTVEEDHVYYVGDLAALVHNTKCEPKSLKGFTRETPPPPGGRSPTAHFNSAHNAMSGAMKWLTARGFTSGDATLARLGPKGTINGMRSGDVGYRVEFDARSGAHINVFAGKEKWHFAFPGGEGAAQSLLKQLSIPPSNKAGG